MNTGTETALSKKDRDKKDVMLGIHIMFAMLIFYSLALACYFFIIQFSKVGYWYEYYTILPFYILTGHQHIFIAISSFVFVYLVEKNLHNSYSITVYTIVILFATLLISAIPHLILLLLQFIYSDKFHISLHVFVVLFSFPLYAISIPLSAILFFSTRNDLLFRLTLYGWSVTTLFGLLFLNGLAEWSYSENS